MSEQESTQNHHRRSYKRSRKTDFTVLNSLSTAKETVIVTQLTINLLYLYTHTQTGVENGTETLANIVLEVLRL